MNPIRRLRPAKIEIVAAVGEPNTTLRRFRVWSEGTPENARLVEAFGVLDAMAMAEEFWPDGDPWAAEEVEP